MHVFFSGIGGTGIGPLALIAKQAGYKVSGSDKQLSSYIGYLKSKGIDNISIGQTTETIAEIHNNNPIDWLVYSSAILKENPNHPELVFAKNNNITATKRDEFINKFLDDSGQKMIAISGTHGKTTTTAMTIWLFKQLGIPVSYSVGAKLSFGDMGEFDVDAEYFVYEADEYDKNFLSFLPEISIIPGIDYDHPDIYPSREDYNQAFRKFIDQSKKVIIWQSDAEKLELSENFAGSVLADDTDLSVFSLSGLVNRQNAHAVVVALEKLGLCDYSHGVTTINQFPGVSRRFERIVDGVYSDYAHTPEKIRGALQMAQEVAGGSVVVVYEGLHNNRQHFIINELMEMFDGVKKLYIVPSYLAREDESLEMLTPEKLCKITQRPAEREPVKLDEKLKGIISEHVNNGDLVLCLTAGGGGSLDEWLRKQDFRI